MKRLLLSLVVALTSTSCVTVNGRSLRSLLPGNQPAAQAPAAATSAPQAKAETGANASKFLAATQPLVLDAEATENPLTLPDLTVGPKAAADSVKLKCPMIASQGVYQVQPVTRFEVKTRTSWSIESDVPLAVQAPDGSCGDASGDWAPGTYSLFAVINNREDRKTVSIAVANLERRFAVAADVPRVAIGDVLPQAFELQTALVGPTIRSRCGAATARPSLIVELAKPITGAIELLFAPQKVRFVVVPLSEAPLRDACKDREARDRFPAGAYALFAASAEPVTAWAAVEPRQQNSSSWPDEGKWALRTLREVPVTVPLPERVLRGWYPWYRSSVAEPLFLEAPKALFVSVSTDSAPVSVGEPVLLVQYGPEQSQVLRATGERVTVRTERLSDLQPDVKLPTLPELKTGTNRYEDWVVLTPYSLMPRAQVWRAQQYKTSDCIDAYMRQKDPSWGKQNYIVIASQREAHLAAANKRCNSKALDDAWLKLKADVAAERKSLRAKLAALPARLK